MTPTTDWLREVGFVQLSPEATWDKRELELGLDGEGCALTVFPDEADPTDRWFVRPRLGGGGVAIPAPETRQEVLDLCRLLRLRRSHPLATGGSQ